MCLLGAGSRSPPKFDEFFTEYFRANFLSKSPSETARLGEKILIKLSNVCQGTAQRVPELTFFKIYRYRLQMDGNRLTVVP